MVNKIKVDHDRMISQFDTRILGGFLAHSGNIVYVGIVSSEAPETG